MPWLQDSFSGNSQRAWQRLANPVHVKALLHLALESRPQGPRFRIHDALDLFMINCWH
jgi:hypothetical protein